MAEAPAAAQSFWEFVVVLNERRGPDRTTFDRIVALLSTAGRTFSIVNTTLLPLSTVPALTPSSITSTTAVQSWTAITSNSTASHTMIDWPTDASQFALTICSWSIRVQWFLCRWTVLMLRGSWRGWSGGMVVWVGSLCAHNVMGVYWHGVALIFETIERATFVMDEDPLPEGERDNGSNARDPGTDIESVHSAPVGFPDWVLGSRETLLERLFVRRRRLLCIVSGGLEPVWYVWLRHWRTEFVLQRSASSKSLCSMEIALMSVDWRGILGGSSKQSLCIEVNIFATAMYMMLKSRYLKSQASF